VALYTSQALCNPAAMSGWSSIVELRRYTLHPGQRDVLIELFDERLVEPQEDVGMKILGQFVDLDDPDSFVWLRGYRDLASRPVGLASFYGGPVWKANRDAANATMIDSDNVLLLRPAHPGSGFVLPERRPAVGAHAGDRGAIAATVAYLGDAPQAADALELFESTIVPAVSDAGGALLASFVSERSPNDFPALPVREDESVLVWFVAFPDRPRLDAGWDRLGHAEGPLSRRLGLERPLERLRLIPTRRSLVAGHGSPSRRARTSRV
jgi:NIPSNAP